MPPPSYDERTEMSRPVRVGEKYLGALTRDVIYLRNVSFHYHVSSALNRESIRLHGLDWRRMGAARGIAGSRQAEQEGCFLIDNEFEVTWLVNFDSGCGPYDVWEVAGVDLASLVQSPEGYYYFPGTIPPDRIRLHESDREPLRQ